MPQVIDLVNLSREFGVDYIIWGLYTLSHNRFKIYLKIIVPYSEDEVKVKLFETHKDSLSYCVSKISEYLINFLQLKLRILGNRKQLKDTKIVPEKMDAYEYLMKGFLFHIGYKREEMIDSAIYYYKKALLIDSTNFYVLYNLGNAYLKKKDFNKALYFYSKAQNRGFIDPDLLNNMACVYIFLNEYEKAKFYIKKAISITGETPFILLNKGVISYKQRKYAEANVLFNKALTLDPQNYRAMYYPVSYTHLTLPTKA